MTTDQHVFSWKDFSSWQNFIQDFFVWNNYEFLPEAVRNAKDDFEYIDDLYFSKFYEKFGNYSELLKSFLKQFVNRFTFVKMYHCCRPLDTRTYYDFGIRVLDTSEMNARFRNLFLNHPKFVQVTETHINEAIEYMAVSYKRHGYVYYGLDDRFLVNHCGHYLIAGSEYLQGLAAFIKQQHGCDLEAELRKNGKPTVFMVKIPLKTFSECELRELVSEFLHTWAYNIAHNKTSSYELDFGKEVDHGLLPDNIIGHYHPVKIPDPSNYYRIYRFEENET